MLRHINNYTDTSLKLWKNLAQFTASGKSIHTDITTHCAEDIQNLNTMPKNHEVMPKNSLGT